MPWLFISCALTSEVILFSFSFVFQGDTAPDGGPKAVHGFKDADGKERKLPLEVFAIEDSKPTYEITLEDDGRPLSQACFSLFLSLASSPSPPPSLPPSLYTSYTPFGHVLHASLP
jgi:hypothetical protein